jgi:hypothetical protein
LMLFVTMCNVFNVSVVDRFVISGIERHWLYFQCARHFIARTLIWS